MRLLGLACLLLAACAVDEVSAAPDADLTCAQPVGWFLSETTTHDQRDVVTGADNEPGALRLFAAPTVDICGPAAGPACMNGLVDLGQTAFGDYDVTVAFDDFTPAGLGAAVTLYAFEPDGGLARVGLQQGLDGLELYVYLYAGGSEAPAIDEHLAAGVDGGTLRLRRTGGVLTLTASAGETVLERHLPVAGAGQVPIGVAVHNLSDTDLAGETSVRITDFAAAGENLQADPFECDWVP